MWRDTVSHTQKWNLNIHFARVHYEFEFLLCFYWITFHVLQFVWQHWFLCCIFTCEKCMINSCEMDVQVLIVRMGYCIVTFILSYSIVFLYFQNFFFFSLHMHINRHMLNVSAQEYQCAVDIWRRKCFSDLCMSVYMFVW